LVVGLKVTLGSLSIFQQEGETRCGFADNVKLYNILTRLHDGQWSNRAYLLNFKFNFLNSATLDKLLRLDDSRFNEN
jgi:hypothetical protein